MRGSFVAPQNPRPALSAPHSTSIFYYLSPLWCGLQDLGSSQLGVGCYQGVSGIVWGQHGVQAGGMQPLATLTLDSPDLAVQIKIRLALSIYSPLQIENKIGSKLAYYLQKAILNLSCIPGSRLQLSKTFLCGYLRKVNPNFIVGKYG